MEDWMVRVLALCHVRANIALEGADVGSRLVLVANISFVVAKLSFGKTE